MSAEVPPLGMGDYDEPKQRRAVTGRLLRLENVDLDLLGVNAGASVLDVGCGVGWLMQRLARRGCDTVGIDLIREELRTSHRRLEEHRKRVRLVEGDAGRLPFVDGAFDFVTCTETLEHLADERMATNELVRVLKRGGRLVVSVPDLLPDLMMLKLSEYYRTDPWGHKRLYTRKRIVSELEAAGVRVLAVRLRNSLEAGYWTLLFLADACTYLKPRAVPMLERWRERSNADSYNLFYHVLDKVGNGFFPKSIVVYAVKP
jgi:ubiquinone/menaquinone biosynthesis C-methylase UbiE